MIANSKSTVHSYSVNQERLVWEKRNSTIDKDVIVLGKLLHVKKPGIQNKTRQQWISEVAYYKAEARVFAHGQELNDWLEAEKDYIDMLLSYYLSIFEEDGGMTKANLQQLAKAIGIETPEVYGNKTRLVQAIQKTSHRRSCFRSDSSIVCKKQDCQWKAECQKLIAVWMR